MDLIAALVGNDVFASNTLHNKLEKLFFVKFIGFLDFPSNFGTNRCAQKKLLQIL